jgi:TetR/AcrR family transcriptional regulator, cholesterol catabolism regulator
MAATAKRDQLTPRQAERRQRVIEAALQLGAEGGYDAVQMRDVAQRAGVALGTIYRYFTSKDHLLAAALAEWTRELHQQVVRTPPTGWTAADRMVDVLRRACRALERQPRLAAAVIRALGSQDHGVAISSAEATALIHGMGEMTLASIEPKTRDAILDVIGHVWYSTLIMWTNGQRNIHQVADELEQATRLLLACHDPYASGNGSTTQ